MYLFDNTFAEKSPALRQAYEVSYLYLQLTTYNNWLLCRYQNISNKISLNCWLKKRDQVTDGFW